MKVDENKKLNLLGRSVRRDMCGETAAQAHQRKTEPDAGNAGKIRQIGKNQKERVSRNENARNGRESQIGKSQSVRIDRNGNGGNGQPYKIETSQSGQVNRKVSRRYGEPRRNGRSRERRICRNRSKKRAQTGSGTCLRGTEIEAINVVTRREKMRQYRKRPGSLFLLFLVSASAVITVAALLLLIGYILIRGIPNLRLSMFEWNYTTENFSMMPAIINTFLMVGMALILAVPVGLFSAIYLVEYAKKGSRMVRIIRLAAETLAGIPSIVYGLFGSLMFGISLGFGYSMISGALTLAIMVLPTILRTSEEALMSVPDSYREGSFGLGAGRLRTVFRIVLPSAVPGILSGIILAVGRICGETAALIYTSGTVAGIPESIFDSGRTLAIHMYALYSEGLHMEEANATSVVLLVMVVLINSLSAFVAKRFGTGHRKKVRGR